MNKRILMVVATATLLTTSTGCTPFKNFFFGRGAKCGLCNRMSAPFKRNEPVVAPPPCSTAPCGPAPCGPAPCNPTPYSQSAPYHQPAYAQPAPSCGCYPNPCGDQCSVGYGSDPYATVIGNGVSGNWEPRPTVVPEYQSNYGSYEDSGYKIDRDGARIIHEDPLPPGAMAPN